MCAERTVVSGWADEVGLSCLRRPEDFAELEFNARQDLPHARPFLNLLSFKLDESRDKLSVTRVFSATRQLAPRLQNFRAETSTWTAASMQHAQV